MKLIDDKIKEIYKEKSETLKRRMQANKERIYDKLPEVKSIDEEIASLGINYASKIASGKMDASSANDSMKSKLSELKDKRDKLLKSIKMNDVSNLYECPICADTGMHDGKRCICSSGYVKEMMMDICGYLSSTKPDIENQNFAKFDFDLYPKVKDPKMSISPYDNIKSIYKMCVSFCADFDKKYENLYIYGPSGCGKTFMINCITERLLQSGYTVLSISAYKLFNFLNDYNFDKISRAENKKYIDAVYECDLLVIDDLGTEFRTSFADTVFFDLLNTRMLNKKSIVITSNITEKSLVKSYTDRIHSRILGDFELLRFSNTDIRLAMKSN